MKFSLKKLSHSPIRWELADDQNKTLISISESIRRKFGYREGEHNSDLALEKIKKGEFEYLKSTMLDYLAKAERSPLALKNWLRRRLLDKETKDALFGIAESSFFVSSSRYTSIALKKFEVKGSKPLWIIKKELESKGVKQEDIESIKFDEKEALKNYIMRNKRKMESSKDKFIHSLMSKGFRYSLVDEVMKENGFL